MPEFKLDFVANTEALTDGLRTASNGLQQLGEEAIEAGKATQKAFSDTGGVEKQSKSLKEQVLTLARLETEMKKILAAKKGAFDPVEIKKYNDQLDKTKIGLQDIDSELSQVETTSKSLKAQLRENKEILSQMEEQGLDTTETFIRLAIETGRLEDQIGDTNERIRFFASDTRGLDGLIGVAKAATAGFSVAEGAAALFGAESENVQKALLKVNAAMAILNGLQEIQQAIQKSSAARLTIENALRKIRIFIMGGETVAINTLTAAESRALVMSRALRIALIGLGVGVVIAGIIAIANAMGAFKDETEEANKALEEQENRLQRLQEQADKSAARRAASDGGINSIKREIEVLEARGATAEEIFNKEQELRKKELEEIKILEVTFEGHNDKLVEVRQERLDKENEIEAAAIAFQREQRTKAQEQSLQDRNKAEEQEQKRLEATLGHKKKLYEQEAALAKESNDLFKALFAERQEDEEDVFDQRVKLLNDLEQIRLLELDLEFEQGDKSIAQAKEIARQKLEVEIDFARQKLELLRESGGSVVDIAALELQIKKAQNEIEGLEQDENPIFKALGLGELSGDERERVIQGIKIVADNVKSVLSDLNQAALQTNANLLNNIEQQIRATESNIEQQADLQAKGLANNLDREVNNLEELQRVRDEALEKHKKLQRQQLNIDAAAQVSSLIVAAANIFKATSEIPFVGVPLAIAAIASMFAAFAVAQVKARQSISQQTFREGGMVKGKRHSQGGERYYSDSGNLVEIEEAEWVTRREQTAKYLPLLKAINSDTLKHMNLQELLANTGVRLNPDKINEVRLIQKSNQEAELRHRISIENEIGNKELSKLREDFNAFAAKMDKKGEIIPGDGFIIEKRGNRTIKHKTNGGKG